MFPDRRQPFPRAEISGNREVNPPAVDARSLGARPQGTQRASFIRSVRTDAPSAETQGPSERSIFPLRNMQDKNGIQSRSLGDRNTFQRRSPVGNNGSQQASPRDESARDNGYQDGETARQSFQIRFPKSGTSFQNGPSRGEGRSPIPGRSRAGRSRASRDSDVSESRRRKRGAEDSFNRGGRKGPAQKVWTEEEQQYLKEKAKQESQKSLEYEPADLSRETFTGMGPATASDEWGMSEMLGERLLLARKHLDREFIQWDSKEQKADVMAVVEKLKAVRAAKPTDGDEQIAQRATSTSGNGDQQAQALMQKLLGGSYDKFKRSGEKDVLGLVERYVHRNDSYYPDDEKSLLKKVRSILPAEQISKAARSGGELKA